MKTCIANTNAILYIYRSSYLCKPSFFSISQFFFCFVLSINFSDTVLCATHYPCWFPLTSTLSFPLSRMHSSIHITIYKHAYTHRTSVLCIIFIFLLLLLLHRRLVVAALDRPIELVLVAWATSSRAPLRIWWRPQLKKRWALWLWMDRCVFISNGSVQVKKCTLLILVLNLIFSCNFFLFYMFTTDLIHAILCPIYSCRPLWKQSRNGWRVPFV